jgi:hypothetical protein
MSGATSGASPAGACARARARLRTAAREFGGTAGLPHTAAPPYTAAPPPHVTRGTNTPEVRTP